MNLERYIGRTPGDKLRFVTSLLMDLIGMGSFVGWLGGPVGASMTEGSDAIFAPIQAAYLYLAYRGSNPGKAAILGAAEELLPMTDFVPTCTLFHIYAMRRKYGGETLQVEAK